MTSAEAWSDDSLEEPPTAGQPDPERRVELAAIWLAEATAELNDALLEADRMGVQLAVLARGLKMSPEGVRQRLNRLKELGRASSV